MSKKIFLASVLGYLVPTFILGFFWHLIWFHEVYATLDIYRSDVIIPMGLLSMFIQAILFSWAFSKLFNSQDSTWLQNGLKAFLFFGCLAWSFLVLPVAAKFKMTSVLLFLEIETAFTFIQFAITMPLIGFIQGKK